MAFELYISNKLVRQKQFASYIPFSSADCQLPDCTATVFEMGEDTALFEMRGAAFRDYSGDPHAVLIPGVPYCVVPYQSGIIVQSSGPDGQIKGIAHIDPGMKQVDLLADTRYGEINISYDLLLCSYQYICANAGALLMHAAAVVYRGEAIVFCGVSGAGKSTQAGHWVRYYDAEPINYDHPCIIWKDGAPFVYGTPWGGKEQVHRAIGAPVKAIVFVHKNEHSSVCRMTKGEAYSRLALNNSFPHVNPDLDRKYYSTIERLVKCVPVYHQEGALTREAPDVLFKELYGVL